MLNALVEVSLRYKVLVLIVFLVVGFLGLRAVRSVPIDAFPDVTPAQVNIYTESPGLAAEDVEQLLTFPVESAMAGLPKVQEIRSVSLFGLSYVAVYFEDDMDIYFARQLVGERLQEVEIAYPKATASPRWAPTRPGSAKCSGTRSSASQASARIKSATWTCARCRTGSCGWCCVPRRVSTT